MKIYLISQKLPSYYTIKVARDPNTSPEILAKILSRGKSDDVSYFALENPNCPPEALAKVLRMGNDDPISWHAVGSPNCPVEALAEVLGRGKDDDVSWFASKNPNCPPLAKIKWMRAVGLIGTEDPNKHIIEYDSKETKDEDLEKLEKLISKNMNWYKRAEKLKDVELKGKLQQAKNGFVYLDLPDDLINGLFAIIDENNISKPPYNQKKYNQIGAHVSVIDEKEIKDITIKEVGKEFNFSLGALKSTTPKTWDDVEKVYFLQIDSPDLENLRNKYGLPKKLNGHEFHITVAVEKA